MTTQLGANATYLHRAYATPIRSRWDYFSADHSLQDMATAKYFRTVMGLFKPGDLVHVIDKNEDEALIRIQYVDPELSEVGIAIERPVLYEPVDGDYQIRHAGGRGRGTRYQIVDPDGKVVMDNIAGKKTAERELDEIRQMAA